MTRAAIYTRISRDREGAGLGVDRQRDDCLEVAARMGWQVVAEHQDNDLSAYSGKPRPGYLALLEQIKAGAVDAVIVWHTDRLHRSPVELEAYITACEPRGVVTQTVKAGALDLSTPTGRMVARTVGGIARYEVEHAIERAQRAKLQAATAGRWKGGRRPYGYEADGVTVRPSEAVEVIAMTAQALAGVSLAAIARDLNARGVTTSTGGRWVPTEVRKMIVRPRNAGLMEHRGEVIGAAEWPALVPEQTWQAARALLTNPGRRTTTSGARRWLGSGLYLCGVCANGTTVQASQSGGGKGRAPVMVYACTTSKHVVRRCAQVDELVEGVIVGRLSGSDVTDLMSPSATATDSHVERLAVNARLDELAELHATGAITGAQLKRGTASLLEQLESLDRQLAAESGRSILEGMTGANADASWKAADLSRKRAILDTLMVVTLMPAKRGRPAGWTPGEPYFDPDTVRVDWRAS